MEMHKSVVSDDIYIKIWSLKHLSIFWLTSLSCKILKTEKHLMIRQKLFRTNI